MSAFRVLRSKSKTSPFDAACVVDFPTFVVGAQSVSSINVAVVMHDAGGPAVGEPVVVLGYLSSDALGATLSAAPGSGIAVGTNGTILPIVAGTTFHARSTAAGLFDVTLTGAGTYYLCLVMPNGRLFVSPVITIV